MMNILVMAMDAAVVIMVVVVFCKCIVYSALIYQLRRLCIYFSIRHK
jgi:hypothetical protein